VRQVASRSRTMMGAKPSNGSPNSRIFGSHTSARANRQHLLLAAREIGAAARPPLAQAREHLVDARERPALRRRESGQDDVLLDVPRPLRVRFASDSGPIAASQ
jgi:hypothetical protein